MGDCYMMRRGAQTLVFDSFNRANGNLGITETGQAWQTNGANTTAWVVSSNVAKRSTPTTSANDAAYVDCGKSNVAVTADITISDLSYGISLFARMSGSNFNNCVFLNLGKDGFIRIQKIISGTSTIIASASYSYVSGSTYACKLICFGNTFYAYINDELKITVDDDNALKTNTKVGMYLPCAGSTALDWFDNFVVRG